MTATAGLVGSEDDAGYHLAPIVAFDRCRPKCGGTGGLTGPRGAVASLSRRGVMDWPVAALSATGSNGSDAPMGQRQRSSNAEVDAMNGAVICRRPN